MVGVMVVRLLIAAFLMQAPLLISALMKRPRQAMCTTAQVVTFSLSRITPILALPPD